MAKHRNHFPRPNGGAGGGVLISPKTQHEQVVEQLLIAQNHLLSVQIDLLSRVAKDTFESEQHRILFLAALGIGVTTQEQQIKAANDLAKMTREMEKDA